MQKRQDTLKTHLDLFKMKIGEKVRLIGTKQGSTGRFIIWQRELIARDLPKQEKGDIVTIEEIFEKNGIFFCGWGRFLKEDFSPLKTNWKRRIQGGHSNGRSQI